MSLKTTAIVGLSAVAMLSAATALFGPELLRARHSDASQPALATTRDVDTLRDELSALRAEVETLKQRVDSATRLRVQPL